MEKKLIHLTEQDLHNIVKTAVQRIITENMEDEGLWNTLKSFGRQYGNKGMNKASEIGQKVGANVRNMGGKLNQKYQNAKQDVSNTWRNASQDGSMKDMQRKFQEFINAVEKYKRNGGQIDRQLNSRIAGISNMLNSYEFH